MKIKQKPNAHRKYKKRTIGENFVNNDIFLLQKYNTFEKEKPNSHRKYKKHLA